MKLDEINQGIEEIPQQWRNCKITGLPSNLVPHTIRITADTRTKMLFNAGTIELTIDDNPRKPEWDTNLREVIEDLRRSAPAMEVIFT